MTIKIEDVFIGKAKKYNHYLQGGRNKEHSCERCVRKCFSHPYTCNEGWAFIREGKGREKGETCLNWAADCQCKVE